MLAEKEFYGPKIKSRSLSGPELGISLPPDQIVFSKTLIS